MVVNGIDTRDISVVVQGAVGNYLPTCLASVREHLPGAEIVLSTWKGSDIEGLDYDVLALNDDPGGFDCMNDDYDKRNNVDRQTVSTRAGLQAAGRKYAVKLRTDFSLTSNGFLNWYGKYPKRCRESWLAEKLISCTIYARDPRDPEDHFAAHPSDFFFFGLRFDLLDLFEIGLTAEEDRIWFARKYPDEFRYEIHRFVPEQFLWTNFLKRHAEQTDAIPEDIHDVRRESVLLTERSFAGNLILLSAQQIGITCERDIFHASRTDTCYSHFDWYSLYARYCGGNPFPYCIYRMKAKLKRIRVCLSNRIRNVGEKISRRARGPLKKLASRLIPWAKKLIKPHRTERQWAEWKLEFSTKKLELWRRMRREKERYVISAGGPELSGENLSVVVQGAVGPSTGETLRSIRRILPDAEIILSTWEGSDTGGLDYDVLIRSRDPGPDGLIRRYPHRQIHNVSREILSTFAGVNASTRFFCLKVRSDMQILSDGFIGYYNQFSRCVAQGSYFERRIMVNGTTTSLHPFNIGDRWYLGTRKDLQFLFDIPLYPKEDQLYFEKEKNVEKKPFYDTIVCRFIPETYIIYSFLKKVDKKIPPMENGTNDFSHYFDLHKRLIVESFICIEPPLSGIVLPKAQDVDNPFSYRYLLPFERWYREARKAGMIGRVKLPKDCANVMEQIYLQQPHWYNVFNWISIVKSYAKIQQVPFEDMTANIEKKDISFLVCGKIEHHGEWNTFRSLNSIRRFFPDSKVVLATWVGENVERLSGLYDDVVFCERPDLKRVNIFKHTSGSKKYNAINDQRYLVSEALKKVNTKYAVRTRTDFYLINDNIFRFYKKWAPILNKREEGYTVFDQRILVSQYFTDDPRRRSGGYTYMISDCFQFGLTGDLRKLWNGEMISDELMSWFDEHPDCEWENPEQFNHRYGAEQFFLLSLLWRTHPNLPYPRWYFDHESDSYTFETEKILASNVLIGDRRLIGLATKFDPFPIDWLITFNRLLELYLENVDPSNQECLDYLKKLYKN